MLKVFFIFTICCFLGICASDHEEKTTASRNTCVVNNPDVCFDCHTKDVPNSYAQLQAALKDKNHERICFYLKAIRFIPFDHYDQTILHDAVNYGSNTVVRALLKKDGINVNKRNKDGYTPLHLAVRTKKDSIVSILLQDTRLQVNNISKCGQSAIGFAISLGHLTIVSRLLQDTRLYVHQNNRNGSTILHSAILQAHSSTHNDNYIQIICKLLEASGVSVDSANMYGETPLHYACLIGNPIVIQLLLDWGGDTNARNQNGHGQRPIHIAAHFPQCAKILQNAGSQ